MFKSFIHGRIFYRSKYKRPSASYKINTPCFFFLFLSSLFFFYEVKRNLEILEVGFIIFIEKIYIYIYRVVKRDGTARHNNPDLNKHLFVF